MDVRSRIHDVLVNVGWSKNIVCSKGLKQASHAIGLMINIKLYVRGD